MKPQPLTPTATIRCDPRTGQVNGASLSVRPGTPARTSTFGAWGCGRATYDKAGRLLGVEVKDRVSLGALATAAKQKGAPVRRFLQDALPPPLLVFV
jgi:hypothetical protein